MENTLDFVHRLQDHFNNHTIYGLSKRLGITRSTVQKWVRQTGSFDDTTAVRVADILEEKPEYIVACIHAERAKDQEVRKTWEKLAKLAKQAATTAHAAVLALFFVSFLTVPQDVEAGAKNEGNLITGNSLQRGNKDYRKLLFIAISIITILYFF